VDTLEIKRFLTHHRTEAARSCFVCSVGVAEP